MQTIRKISLALIALSLGTSAIARDGFAIVVDPKSYQEARSEIEAYAACIEDINGWKVSTIIDKWGVPDSIRVCLKNMHFSAKDPIVGAVFIGDIPVPMIRDAQHLTSAFKMDQRYPREDSSVPSDRYYDDFGLEFTSLGKDEKENYFYYSLSATGEQHINPDIFSGRIRPSDRNGVSQYDLLRDFLRKAVRVKEERRSLEQMLYFVGHGYISESKVARIDEKAAHFEHFPFLKDRIERIKFIHYDDANPIKPRIIDELSRPDLDLALLHHHGAPDTEYYNEIPAPDNIPEAREFIKKTLRSRVRRAARRGKDIEETKQSLADQYGVPVSWMDDALSDSLARADSLKDALLDLHLEDFALYGFKPNARVVIEDACFNGSFHLSDCIADEYIFNEGNTVAVIANSVNALQDKWSDRLLGLIAAGGVTGDLSRFSTYLESHTIGDPTFSFDCDNAKDIHHMMLNDNARQWKRLLKSSVPEYQCLAIDRLYHLGAIDSDELAKIYLESPYYIVRMMALETIAHFDDDNFINTLILASEDAFELVQRTSVIMMGKSGDPRLIPSLVKLAIRNTNSARVNFDAGSALGTFHCEAVLEEFEKQFASEDVVYCDKATIHDKIRQGLTRQTNRWVEDIDGIMKPETTAKERRSAIRQTRNFMIHDRIPAMMEYWASCPEVENRIAMLESFGWRTMSMYRDELAEFCLGISKDDSYSEEERAEALKTYKRLSVNAE